MTQNVEPGDPWVERLSDYVDDEISRRERRTIAAHLAQCAGCRAVLEELRAVVAAGRRLETPSEPDRDLWPGIASRLKPRRQERASRWAWHHRLTPSLAGLAAVAVACVVVASLWSSMSQRRPPAAPVLSPGPIAKTSAAHEREYERTVAGLEREARAQLTLDPHVIEVLDENLATLDVAIANYRDALAEEPGDARMRERLAAAKERKLEVLRQAVTLAAEGTN